MRYILTIAALALGACTVIAETTGASGPNQAPSSATLAKPAQSAPVPTAPTKPLGIAYGFSERFRFEEQNNTDGNWKVDDESRAARFLSSIYVNVDFNRYISAYGKLSSEGIKKLYNTAAPFNGGPSPFMANEIFFENAYISIKNPWLPGLTATIGRQDIWKNEGWLLSDGTGGNGSRDGYSNAFVIGYTPKGTKQTFEIMGIWNPKTDIFFPVINGLNPSQPGTGNPNATPYNAPAPNMLNEFDQQTLAFYYTNRNHKKSDIDAYFLFNKEYNSLNEYKSIPYGNLFQIPSDPANRTFFGDQKIGRAHV